MRTGTQIQRPVILGVLRQQAGRNFETLGKITLLIGGLDGDSSGVPAATRAKMQNDPRFRAALAAVARENTDSGVDVIDQKLAAAIVRAETLANNSMSAEMAKALLEYNVASAAQRTPQAGAARDNLKTVLNNAISPGRVAFLTKVTSLLQAARTRELEDSRERVRSLLANVQSAQH